MEVPQQARVIAGRYELLSLIGEGGMASVWRARDLTLERLVAVKLLFARDDRDRHRLVKQFLREARIAASVYHRNVVHIVDFGTTEQPQEQPFMVMELLEGESLGQRMHREPRLTLAEVVHIAALTLRGLAAVHDAGIIHRDLKPDNVFLTRDRNGAHFPKILDFGISRSIEPRSGRRSALTTREGMIVGTPEYMSPEQARGLRSIDKRTDIYSMGCILYEALTGELPFPCENVGDLIIQIVTGVTPRAHERNREIPQAISDVVAKAMARDVDQRFQNATEMQDALLAAAGSVLEAGALANLSDMPPPTEGLVAARNSQERLRTLEFALEGDVASSSGVTPRHAARLPSSTPGGPLAAPGRAVLPQADSVNEDALRPPRARRTALAALGLAAAAAAVLLIARGSNGESQPIEPSAVAAAPLPPAAPPERTVVKVELRNLPDDATVTVDGVPTPGTPIELPRNGKNRVIRVTAPGKAPWQAVHHASGDGSYDVLLVDLEAPRLQNAALRRVRTRVPAKPQAARDKAPKKPPSALRKLDF